MNMYYVTVGVFGFLFSVILTVAGVGVLTQPVWFFVLVILYATYGVIMYNIGFNKSNKIHTIYTHSK